MHRNFLSRFTGGFALLLIWGVALSHGKDTTILAPGTEAPTFSLPSLSGSRETLRIWCGQELLKPHQNSVHHTVIVSFWATYCKPCEKEIPELEKFYAKHQGENVKVFLISIDEKGAEIVAPFAKERKYQLPVLFDPYKKTAQRFGVKSLPALFVIGPDGIIRYSSVGYKEDVSIVETLGDVVKAIKEGKKVTLQQSGGKAESVAVVNESPASAGGTFSSKQKWSAVARIECGTSPDIIAAELGVSKDELKKWYAELKEMAVQLWDSK